MVKWKEEIVIDRDIDKVWLLFQDRNVQKIMPKIHSHELLEGLDDQAGAKHSQSYYEGKQLMSYVVETKAYSDTPERKERKVEFLMGQSIVVNYSYTLEKLGPGKTRFIYSGFNKGLSASAKMLLLAGSKKSRQATARAFMERVRDEAQKIE
ncbi:MAG TPA: SRPBCC family protein [Planococcus sp. (in: firmicutes)]|nr:SRPBCC family protein [Planococcus sp. (in: firmicutes)]